MLDDQWELIKHIYSNHQLPLILLGHSMGSFLAMHFCQKYNSALSNQNAPQISGLILSGSSYSSPSTWRAALIIAQLERWRKGFDHSSALLEKMSFGAFNNAFEPARTESDWISRDHEVVDNYINDPLCGGPLSTQSWCDFLTGMIELTNLTALAKINSKLPTLLFSGQMDPVSNAGKDVTKLKDTLTKSGMENVAMHLYPGARHEALNEINRLDVFQDIIKWIEGLN
jgi:alpha-beta hydrolase superfamily lysophospholipase